MVAHTLGNPFDLAAVSAFCERHGLWLVEDNCDAAGSRYQGRKTGTFGDLATLSFYPPHHMTMGEGGRGPHQRRRAGEGHDLAPRLGARLLVPLRRGQHLQAALRVAARRPARRATTTSTSTATSATT